MLNGHIHNRLSFAKASQLLAKYKNRYKNLNPRQSRQIPDAYAYFDEDENKNRFTIHVYKTSQYEDKWILFMADENQGYALYQNPSTQKYELAWYHHKLDKPLSPKEESLMITCYVPKNINLK